MKKYFIALSLFSCFFFQDVPQVEAVSWWHVKEMCTSAYDQDTQTFTTSCAPWYTVLATVNTNKTTYAPGETINLSSSVMNPDCANGYKIYDLSASLGGVNTVLGSTAIGGGQTRYHSGTLTAPTTPGAYNITTTVCLGTYIGCSSRTIPITVSSPLPVTGTVSGSGCEIAANASSCTGSATWNITNPTTPDLYNSNGTVYSNSASGSNAPITLSYGSNTVSARNVGTVLASTVLTTSCASGLSWNGGSCVAPPPPAVSLSASPSAINPGDSSLLTWTVSGATSCTASGGWSGAKASGGGTETVSPTVTTTYNLSCTGAGGTTAATPVVVTSPSGFITAGTCTIIPSGATEGTGCDVAVNWGAYDFIGSPSVSQGGASFSSSASGPQTRTVDPDDLTFTLRDTGGTFIDSDTATVDCQAGTVWRPALSHCAFLPIVGINSDSNLIRSGATLDFEISVNSNFDLSCTVRDGGAPQTFSHTASAATEVYPRTTRSLTSAQVVDVTCVSPIDPIITGSDEVRVNVIPTIQEI